MRILWHSAMPKPFPESLCEASGFGNHDYSQPPHNTPGSPRDATDDLSCQTASAHDFGHCDGERRYEIVIYQIATHEWIRLFACVPCTAELRQRHATLGPGGTQGIARVRLYEPAS